MTSRPKLPPELIEAVLERALQEVSEIVEPDKRGDVDLGQALLNLRLVHPDFRNQVDAVLFRRLSLAFRLPAPSVDERSRRRLALLSASDLGKHLESLTVHLSRSDRERDEAGICTIDELFQLPLPALQKLVITREGPAYSGRIYAPQRQSAPLPNLRSLVLHDASSSLYLPHLLQRAPKLSSLVLSGNCPMAYDARGGLSSQPIRPIISPMRELKLLAFETPYMQDWLADLGLRADCVTIVSSGLWARTTAQHIAAISSLVAYDKLRTFDLCLLDRQTSHLQTFSGIGREALEQRQNLYDHLRKACAGRGVKLSMQVIKAKVKRHGVVGTVDYGQCKAVEDVVDTFDTVV